MRIGVIGGGHAGVEAASAAARAGADVILFSSETVLPYYRPRVVALAFGQAGIDEIRIHPEEWYRHSRIDLRLASPVDGIDAQRMTVTSAGETHSFDRIVIATGAKPFLPSFAVGARGLLLPLWTASDAQAIRARTPSGGRVAIVGGGIIGIDAALRARAAGLDVTIIEKADRLMARNLSPAAAAAVSRRLLAKGIDILTGRTVEKTVDAGADATILKLEGDGEIRVALAILCIGATRDVSFAARAGLKTGAGILVDASLRTSADWIYACGDIAQMDQPGPCSARVASAQGRIAGANATASQGGQPDGVQKYTYPVPSISLKFGDFELHTAGNNLDDRCTEQLLDNKGDSAHRAVIVRNGATVGVQMVGTGTDFQKHEASIRGAQNT